MNQNVVLLFAGQGAQEVGMGKSLASDYEQARLLIERADGELGKPLSQVMFSGPVEELTRTSWCQPALYVHGLACWEVLKSRCPSLKPAAAAGLSLGEFTAHAAAGKTARSSRSSSVHLLLAFQLVDGSSLCTVSASASISAKSHRAGMYSTSACSSAWSA